MTTTQKKPWVAFLLSVLLTGAGLAYLGKWGWAVLNFVAALGIGILVAFTLPDASSAVGIGIAVGSAVMAKNLAEKMNKESLVLATPQFAGVLPPTPVIRVSQESKPAEPIVVKATSAVCSKCGSTTEPGNFCSECGSPLS